MSACDEAGQAAPCSHADWSAARRSSPARSGLWRPFLRERSTGKTNTPVAAFGLKTGMGMRVGTGTGNPLRIPRTGAVANRSITVRVVQFGSGRPGSCPAAVGTVHASIWARIHFNREFT